jgi:hypothetical protein
MLDSDCSTERELAGPKRKSLDLGGEGSRDFYKLTATKEAATRILVCICRSMLNIVGPTCIHGDQSPNGRGAEHEVLMNFVVSMVVNIMLEPVLSLNGMPDTIRSSTSVIQDSRFQIRA